ncbi:ornithine/aspartate carbamoyl transferase [Thermoplasma volcanium GSS1]|uniref:Ornithine carbamoyltransferase, catabolic n=2 Tax=Thermoplasma volcanium TaxID=50339 RepID=OTCC_THEVO|nr:ornithine carbamoyltransferase [Thermoplasma volcanium]Q97C32.1 RecName: Full=Ornithine carbamoyltransferase, catabolic; Short=OTCase [Thermoplasma volcanium GSS1]BAB59415.1 ornithine/aspartate carbamoyl transferase [Thermoplasma volcanium GSS1]
MAKRDILSVLDMKNDLDEIINLSIELKKNRYRSYESLRNKMLGLIFEKPSTRTRTSLEVAIDQLGGHAVYLNPSEMQLGRGETISDTGHVLSRFLDAIAYRAFDHKNVVELARSTSIPVINALDDVEHPLQIVADFMTVKEKKGKFSGLKFSYIGDGNNMANSLMLGAAILGVDIYVATPHGYEPKSEFVDKAKQVAKERGSKVIITNDAIEAAKDADVIYTDVWISMGEESKRGEKEKAFTKYQINSDLVSNAKKDYIFMHCLPAHRGLEVTDDVADSINSVIFDEAENRLHSEKGVLYKLLSY